MMWLQQFYEKLLRHKDFPDELKENAHESVLEFSSEIDNVKYELQSNIKRAELLVRFIAGRKIVVRTLLDILRNNILID